jgi:hypothetical protein
VLSAGVATAAAVLVAGTGYAVVGLVAAAPNPADMSTAAAPGDQPAGPVRRVVYAYAGDSTHLYAMTQSCDKPPYGPCPVDLYGSDDGGRTWHGRTLPTEHGKLSVQITVLGPRTLLARGTEKSARRVTETTTSKPTDYISADGGATWRRLKESSKPVDDVPAGHRAYSCIPRSLTESCTVRAVDPVTAMVAPLANQPPIHAVYLLDAPPEAGLWVSGFDPESHRPAVAWSRDAGRTWTKHVFTEAAPVPTHGPPGMAPEMATADGRTAYAIVRTNDDDDAAGAYRTVDGGDTWRLFQNSDRFPSFISGVAGDGAHLLLLQKYGGGEFLASRDGGPYRPQPITGLSGRPPFVPQAMAGGGFFTYVGDADRAVYVSNDGLSWRRIPID